MLRSTYEKKVRGKRKKENPGEKKKRLLASENLSKIKETREKLSRLLKKRSSG